MSYDPRAVANFVLDFCEQKDRPISNLALQKILFFCHAWSLVKLDKPLIKQQFEAWKYGPVIQYLYREFKEYEDRPILTRSKRTNPETGSKESVPYQFDKETADLMQEIVEFYSRLRPTNLVALSHAEGGPWDETWNHKGFVNPGMRIHEDSIKEFYSKAHPPFSIQ